MMHVVRPVVVLLCLLLYADAESKLIVHLCLDLGQDKQTVLFSSGVYYVSLNEPLFD